MILIFQSFYHQQCFVDALKLSLHEFRVDDDDVQIYENKYYMIIKGNVKALDDRYKPDCVLFINKPKEEETRDHWFTCNSATDIETHSGISMTKHAKNRITFMIFGQDITENDALESFLERLPAPRIEILSDEEEDEIREVKRIKSETCHACMECAPCVMFDCGHEPFCEDCVKLWKRTCPICRSEPKAIYLE